MRESQLIDSSEKLDIDSTLREVLEILKDVDYTLRTLALQHERAERNRYERLARNSKI